jgi:hypothetical protein
MASWKFRAGSDFVLNETGESGIGFYGSAFGISVIVDEYQDRTYITDPTGVIQGPECDNVKYYSSTQALLNQTSTPMNLRKIPNYQSTLNISFTHTSVCQAINTKAWVYDGSTGPVVKTAMPTGVLCRIAEIIHPNNTQDEDGTGDLTWTAITASSTNYIDLVDSPGPSGLTPGGTGATTHDWFTIISASPDSIGSKTQFALLAETEHL